MRFILPLSLLSALVFSCQPGAEPCEQNDECENNQVCEAGVCGDPQGLTSLGSLSHSIDEVTLGIISDASDGLNGPRDLDFNPEADGELWVVNRNDDSTVTFFDLFDDDARAAVKLIDPAANHFMEEVSSLSFSSGQKFGTCQESRNTYNDLAAANDFMGPALWSSDLDIYSLSNPEAVAFLTDQFGQPVDLGSHLDMLHESPLCMGIAWVEDNIYYTFDGLTNSISFYDFVEDHGAGFDEHDDGIVRRFTDANVVRVADVPSHMVYDPGSEFLYIADTGNQRIVRFDTDSGSPAFPVQPLERGVDLMQMDGGDFETFISQSAGEFSAPSGIALKDGILYVTDNGNSRISAFDLEGNLIDYLDTELPAGSLMGIRIDDAGEIWTVDNLGNQLINIK